MMTTNGNDDSSITVSPTEVTVSIVIVTVIILLVILNIIMYAVTRVMTDPNFFLRKWYDRRRPRHIPIVKVQELITQPIIAMHRLSVSTIQSRSEGDQTSRLSHIGETWEEHLVLTRENESEKVRTIIKEKLQSQFNPRDAETEKLTPDNTIMENKIDEVKHSSAARNEISTPFGPNHSSLLPIDEANSHFILEQNTDGELTDKTSDTHACAIKINCVKDPDENKMFEKCLSLKQNFGVTDNCKQVVSERSTEITKNNSNLCDSKTGVISKPVTENGPIPESTTGSEIKILECNTRNKTVISESKTGNDEAIPESKTENEEAIPESKTENDEAIPESKRGNDEAIPESETGNDEAIPESKTGNDKAIPESKTGNDEPMPESKTGNDKAIPESKTKNKANPETNTGNKTFPKSNTGNECIPKSNTGTECIPKSNTGNEYIPKSNTGSCVKDITESAVQVEKNLEEYIQFSVQQKSMADDVYGINRSFDSVEMHSLKKPTVEKVVNHPHEWIYDSNVDM